MIFGVLRSCYEAPARFQVGGPVDAIRWYYAPEGAEMYTAPNIFFPLSQTLQYKPTDGVGELHGGGFPYRNGRPLDSWDGLEAHGTEEDFLGETEFDGPTALFEVPDCAAPPIIAFGGGAIVPEIQPALAFGGVSILPPRLPCYPWCQENVAPSYGFVTFSCPDIPALDGLKLFMFRSDYPSGCSFGHVPLSEGEIPIFFGFGLDQLEFPQVSWNLYYYPSPLEEWVTYHPFFTDDWACDPFTIVGEGALTRIGGDGIPVPFAWRFTVPSGPGSMNGVMEFGGEISHLVPSPDDEALIEFGGETRNVALGPPLSACIEFGGRRSITEPQTLEIGGVEFGGETESVPLFRGGVEFGSETTLLP